MFKNVSVSELQSKRGIKLKLVFNSLFVFYLQMCSLHTVGSVVIMNIFVSSGGKLNLFGTDTN